MTLRFCTCINGHSSAYLRGGAFDEPNKVIQEILMSNVYDAGSMNSRSLADPRLLTGREGLVHRNTSYSAN